MTDAAYRLVYYSKNAIPGSQADIAREVEQILASSRRNNAACGVTGALLFNAGCFAQVLEGPLAAVERTFERIQRDPRHTEVMVLQLGPIEKRGFPAWSMAFTGQSAEGQARFGRLAEESGFSPALFTGERVFEILRGLVLQEEDEPLAT